MQERFEKTTTNFSLTWLLTGLLGAVIGIGVAIALTAWSLNETADEYAGFRYMLTVPVGYLAGWIGTVAFAPIRANRRERPAGAWPRRMFVFLGGMLPVLLLVLAAIVPL